MNMENKFAKEIETELLAERPVKLTARGDLMSANALLGSIGNDIVTLQKALASMASAVDKLQAGIKEAHEMIERARGRL